MDKPETSSGQNGNVAAPDAPKTIEEPAAIPALAQSASHSSIGRAAFGAVGTSPHILIVDDDEFILKLLSVHLWRGGYTLTTAESGEAALRQLERRSFDAILLDINMPGISGMDVLQTVRSGHSSADLPVVMISANGTRTEIAEALREGANDYIVKPFDIEIVLCRVKNQILSKRAFESIQASERRMQELDVLKKDFFYMVTHELNTPISSSLSALSLLSERCADQLSEKELRYLQISIRNLQRLSRLSGDLINVAKMESGSFRIVRSPVSVSLIARSVCINLALKSIEYGVSIEWKADDAGSSARAMADADRIEQAITNLAQNAMRFAYTSVLISIEADGPWIQISVDDDGPGFQPADMPRLFTKFFRGAAPANRQYSGNGLGLAIAKFIVEAHGGTIDASNRRNINGDVAGARMLVRIPVGPANSPPGAP